MSYLLKIVAILQCCDVRDGVPSLLCLFCGRCGPSLDVVPVVSSKTSSSPSAGSISRTRGCNAVKVGGLELNRLAWRVNGPAQDPAAGGTTS